jgi:cell division protein FtsB
MTGTRTIPRDRPRLTGRAGALLVAVALLAMVALVPLRSFLEQRGHIADLERDRLALQVQNARLRRDISNLHDPVELERLARECLGMVGPNETALIVPGAAADRSDC